MNTLENVPPQWSRRPAEISLPVKELLVQTARSIPLSSNKEIVVPWDTTIGNAAQAAAGAVQTNNTRLVLVKPPQAGTATVLNALRQRVQLRNANSGQEFLKVRTFDTSPIGEARHKSRTQAGHEALRKMRDKAKSVLGKDPYAVTIKSNIFDRFLPCLPSASLRLTGVDDDNGPTCTIPTNTLYLYDTGCYLTTISDDLIDPDFLSYLRSPSYTSRNGDHSIFSIDSMLRFSNTDIEILFIGQVIPKSKMPNETSGVLLGQCGLIDHIQMKTIPRALLEEDGENLAEDVWGDIIIERYYDAEAALVVTL